MPYTAIQFETDGPVATITMDRPEKRNVAQPRPAR